MGFSNRRRLPRSAVECSRDSSKVASTVPIEVSTFGEVLAQQTVGVLVRTTLPRAAGIAEENLQPSVDTQLGVLGHLRALVPGQ